MQSFAQLKLSEDFRILNDLHSFNEDICFVQVGVVVNGDVVKLKVLAITGDLPALKIALNFVAHNGYYCCYFCYLRGVHQEGKRQYSYKCPLEIRTADSFARDSTTASRFKRNEKGHLGVSVVANLLDIQLPYSIIIDYAHASLLRHSKSIFSELYGCLSPAIRNDVDIALAKQPFPHFFHRHMKSFKDLLFIKATEVRNILFYGFLPIFHQHLPLNVTSHFALYISGMRLLHGSPIFGDQTSTIANALLMKYYEDFRLYYHGLENITLHLHSHYKNQHERFGAFSHLGSFGQEGLMGYMESNYTGTRYQGDLIVENYSLDLIIHLEINDLHSFAKTTDGPFDKDSNFNFTSNYVFVNIHNSECSCRPINRCLTAFRRCVVHRQVYHSMHYKRRQKSIGYFVRYCHINDRSIHLFSKIIMFFSD
ncbi:unnamed protein product [Rotaria sp. Silwood2]|nr:unnamed protein product [Rotaria sp. Silwood2]CAF4454865.1 unnamed protein product [Rotaria sp. Silwood2]